MINRYMTLFVLIGIVCSNAVFASNCQNTVFRDGFIKQELVKNYLVKDLELLLNKYESSNAKVDDYYMLGLSHRLGFYLKRDINQSAYFYLQALSLIGTETDEDYRRSLYKNINFELGLLTVLCDEQLTNKSALYYFTEASKNNNHKEALYFKSIIELYSLGKISKDNKNIHSNLIKFQSLIKDISAASSHGIALASFEMLYISIQLSSPIQSIEKAKERLFKSQFFKSCDYFLIQKNSSMPYRKEIDNRVKLIKELNFKYFQICN